MRKKVLSITLMGTILLMAGCTNVNKPVITETTQTITEAIIEASTEETV